MGFWYEIKEGLLGLVIIIYGLAIIFVAVKFIKWVWFL